MKVLLVWSGGAVPAYWEFLSRIGERLRLRVLAPRRWTHGSEDFRLNGESAPPRGFALTATVFWRFGDSAYLVPRFLWELLRFRPDAVYFMDEADRVATLVHLAAAFCLWPKARRINYNLQNLDAPSYHRLRHRLCLRGNRVLLHETVAATAEAGTALRAHGIPASITIPLFASEAAFFPATPEEKGELRRHWKIPEGRLVLIYAGSLSAAKGVDLLLRAIPAHPGLYLLLAGTGPLEPQAGALPASAGRHLGTLPLPRLREVYQCGDCIILPSRDTPEWKEQIGRVLLEGILCGCLGLGSDGGFIPELLGTPETIFPQGDFDALNGFLEKLPRLPSRRLWEQQRDRTQKHFSAAVVARNTADFFDREESGNQRLRKTAPPGVG